MTVKHKNTTKKSITSTTKVLANEVAVCPTTARDAQVAVLVVSLVVNLFFLTAWVLLQVTSQYDYAVASAIFTR
jgi:hypothetical protein